MHLPKQTTLLIVVLLASCAGNSQGQGPITIRGAGSTFDEPFFSKAIPAYESLHGDVLVAYSPVGSEEGVRRFVAGDVDFGASDVPLLPEALARLESRANGIVEFPVTLGGVAVVYNLPAEPHLRLTSASLVGIYSATISYWDDKAIGASNPGVSLPHLPILAIHRADSSGSTYIFTDYLSAASERWKTRFGRATQIAWPGASTLRETGTSALGARVKHTIGSIGYVVLSSARQSRLATAAVENSSGQFVIPSTATVRAAAANLKYPSPEKFSLVVAKGGAYPLSAYSWAMLATADPQPDRRRAVCALFYWILTDGQKMAEPLDYAPLPVNATAAQLDNLATCANSTKTQ